MSSESRQVLVTGAGGWLGRRLVDTLVHGLPDTPSLRQPSGDLRVRALVLDPADAPAIEALSDRVEVVVGDLRNPDVCERLCRGAEGGVLYHAAGVIHPRRVADFYAVNVQGTKNVLAAASRAGVRRAVVVSSNSPFGGNPSREHRFDEQSDYHPYMNYGRSKMRMELLVRDVQRSGSISTVIIRAPWFYGPYQPPRQTLFFTMIRDGKMPLVGDGGNLRSMAYVDNLCQGMQLAAGAPAADGKAYWIADRAPYAMRDIIDTVERLLETEFQRPCVHKRMALPNLASDVARMIDGLLQSVGIYQQKIHVLSEMNMTIACTVAKAERELGYQPAIALEEGMRRSIRWCIEQGHL